MLTGIHSGAGGGAQPVERRECQTQRRAGQAMNPTFLIKLKLI